MKQTVFIHITNNKVTNRQVLVKAFHALKDGRYKVSIDNANKRSNNQNAYLHGVVIPLVFEGLREIGYNNVRDHEDAKEFIKTLFLKRKITNEKNGDVVEIVRHTSELTTVEMMAFIEEVVIWAATYLCITIPEPNTQAVMFAAYDSVLNTMIVK